jgi:hypothetical protein
MPPAAQTDVGWIPAEAKKKLKEKAENAAQENGGAGGKAEASAEAKAGTDGAKKEDA